MIRRFVGKIADILGNGTFVGIWALFTLIGLAPELLWNWRSSPLVGAPLTIVLRNAVESLPFAAVAYYYSKKNGKNGSASS